jgi:predicted aspartyl protease
VKRVVVLLLLLLGRVALAGEIVPGGIAGVSASALNEDALYASPTRIDHIGRIIAPVMIDGRGPFRFIVDTGASGSTVAPSLATRLLTGTGDGTPVEVHGITGSAVMPSVAVHRLQAGDLVVRDTNLPVVWAPLMDGADGILGTAGLREQCIFVDFRHNRVVISRSLHSRIGAGFDRVSGAILEGGLLSVSARVANVRVRAIIDTGAERTLGNAALRDALYARARTGAPSNMTRVFGATSDIAAGEMQLSPTIEIGRLELSNVTVVYGDFHIFDVWGLKARPAMIIGMDVLGTVNALAIDFRRGELYLDSKVRFTDPAALAWQ